MNWILGLKRLWALASLIITVRICYRSWTKPGLCMSDPDSPIYCGNVPGQRIFEGVTTSVVVVVAMYIVGAGIIWIVRGFRQKGAQP